MTTTRLLTSPLSTNSNSTPNDAQRSSFRYVLCLWVAAIIITCFAAVADAQETTDITRVEEDWVILIGVPDPTNDAPQITSVISPVDGIDGIHAVFELNHANIPSYRAGGMQLQRWDGDQNNEACNFPNAGLLSTAIEVVTYTMSMKLSGSTLTFEVLNGKSTTWGIFGGQGYLKTSTSCTLTNLNSYTPANSQKFSGVPYAPTRVQKLALKEVRYYSGTDLVRTESTERVVHSID